MNTIEIKKQFTNPNLVEDFWIIQNKKLKNIQNDRFMQMGFGDTSAKNYLLDIINNAQETIYVATFLLSDEDVVKALENAGLRGVRSYVLTSNEALLERERKDDPSDFDREVIEHHKKILKSISGSSLVRGSPYLHAKFIIIDPYSNPKGLLFTSNITKEALTRNPELCVILKEEEIIDLFYIFRYGFWNLADKELREKKWAAINNRRIPLPKQNSFITSISNINNLEEELIKFVRNASGTLYIGSYKIAKDNELYDEIIKYAQNNNVVVITRLHTSNQEIYTALSKLKNTKLISSEYFHAKFLASDNGGIVMTANINNQAFEDGFEIGIKISKNNEFIKLIKNWENNLEYIHVKQKYIKDIDSNKIIKLQTDGNMQNKNIIKIKDLLEENKNIKCKTIEEYIKWDKSKEIPPPYFNMNGEIVKNKNIMYTIIPPKLPGNAKKIVNLDNIKNKKLREKAKDLFDDGGKAKYNIFVVKNKLYVAVNSIKNYNKIKSKISNNIQIVFEG